MLSTIRAAASRLRQDKPPGQHSFTGLVQKQIKFKFRFITFVEIDRRSPDQELYSSALSFAFQIINDDSHFEACDKIQVSFISWCQEARQVYYHRACELDILWLTPCLAENP